MLCSLRARGAASGAAVEDSQEGTRRAGTSQERRLGKSAGAKARGPVLWLCALVRGCYSGIVIERITQPNFHS